jgi:hypothetical protein
VKRGVRKSDRLPCRHRGSIVRLRNAEHREGIKREKSEEK